ncbi:hypothetical protein [Tumidithrix helvetica]
MNVGRAFALAGILSTVSDRNWTDDLGRAKLSLLQIYVKLVSVYK